MCLFSYLYHSRSELHFKASYVTMKICLLSKLKLRKKLATLYNDTRSVWKYNALECISNYEKISWLLGKNIGYMVLLMSPTFIWTNVCWDYTTLGKIQWIQFCFYFCLFCFLSLCFLCLYLMFTIVICTIEFILHRSDLLDLILSCLSLSTLMP